MRKIPSKIKNIKVPKLSIQSLNDRLGVIFSLSTKLLILVSIVVVVILLIQALFVPQTFTISEINVPASFEKNGYSTQVLGSRLTDRLTDISKIGSESLEIIESTILKEDKEKSYRRSATISSFDIKVGLFNVSISEVINFLRKKLGYKNIVIDGDLTEENNSLTFSMRLKSNDELIKYNRFERTFSEQRNNKYKTLDQLINETGEFVVFFNDPIILLSYYISEKRGKVTDSLFRMITYDDYFNDQVKLWTYVLWGHTLFTKADEIYYNTFEIDKDLYDQALGKYDIVLEKEPGFVTSIGWNMASYYIDNNQYQKANEIYKKILNIDKKNIDAYYFLAENYNILGQKDEAITCYKKVSKLEPDSEKGVDALYKIAEIYKSNLNYKLTKEYYKKVFMNKNADEYNLAAKAYTGYGDMQALDNKHQEALAYYIKALKFNKNIDIYLKIADSYAILNDTVAFTNYLKFIVDEGYELNDSLLNSPLYLKYKDSRLMKFFLEEYLQ